MQTDFNSLIGKEVISNLSSKIVDQNESNIQLASEDLQNRKSKNATQNGSKVQLASENVYQNSDFSHHNGIAQITTANDYLEKSEYIALLKQKDYKTSFEMQDDTCDQESNDFR